MLSSELQSYKRLEENFLVAGSSISYIQKNVKKKRAVRLQSGFHRSDEVPGPCRRWNTSEWLDSTLVSRAAEVKSLLAS